MLMLFMGLGGHNLYRYNWMWFGAFQIVALRLARHRATADGQTPPGDFELGTYQGRPLAA